MEPTCYMMVGLPASGKSTRVQDMTFMNLDVFVYSTDRLIEEAAERQGITYDEAFEDNIKAATRSMDEMLIVAIQYNQDIIWDQTNLTRKSRAKKLARIPAHYRKVAEVLPELPFTEWEKRLNSRPGKTIPTHILSNMYSSFEPPSVDEGFDEVYTVGE